MNCIHLLDNRHLIEVSKFLGLSEFLLGSSRSYRFLSLVQIHDYQVCICSSLTHRSRSDLTIDSLTESQVGSVTGSESGLLGSVSSLNDTHETNDDTETEHQDDYIPTPGKIVIHNTLFYP